MVYPCTPLQVNMPITMDTVCAPGGIAWGKGAKAVVGGGIE